MVGYRRAGCSRSIHSFQRIAVLPLLASFALVQSCGVDDSSEVGSPSTQTGQISGDPRTSRQDPPDTLHPSDTPPCPLASNTEQPLLSIDVTEAIVDGTLFTIAGRAESYARVQVQTPDGSITVAVARDCSFSIPVSLLSNSVNTFLVRGKLPNGDFGPPQTVRITHDQQPPNLFIDFPIDGAEITTETTDVAGRVGDLLSGFMGLNVTVNGKPAVVDVGIGNNGTFMAPDVSLTLGQPTVIQAIATDQLGNQTSKQITVTRVEIPKGTPQMMVVSGNGQIAQMGSAVEDPIVVQMLRGDGTPFVNKVVTFNVTRSNGRLFAQKPQPGEAGTMMLQVHTDSMGMAQAFWRLGSDAGCGNNRVEATSTSIAGTVAFCASATPGPPAQINIGSGNSQRAETGTLAAEPLRVWVSDACNGVENVPVTFEVTRGSGTVNGESQVTVMTSATGHAEVQFMLGPEPGNQLVRAEFPTNMGRPAEFVIFGVVRDELSPTRFSGIVLDNASQPIEGAQCTLALGIGAPLVTATDSGGAFLFEDVPASGMAMLEVDGAVATSVGGVPVANGTYPALHYNFVMVANAENRLPAPVLLPKLNPNNAISFDNTQDTVLTVEGMDGLQMIVRAGSMTLHDGTVPDANNPAMLSLNQVHHDDVPMPMPDGAAPPFAWTLQPAGATFDPTVEITYPNMSGLPAGGIAYFLSFNHGTEQFEIIGSGQVSTDGSQIRSDPGVGIVTAGWGCNCPPYSVVGACENCARCETVCSTCAGPGASCVSMAADLRIDSNNDGSITPDDETSEDASPGKFISVNHDDDNQDWLPDTLGTPVGTDDELVELSVPSSGSSVGSWWSLEYSSRLRAWRVLPDTSLLAVANGQLNRFPIPSSFKIDALVPSPSPGDAIVQLLYYDAEGRIICSDSVKLTSVRLDFLSDSNMLLPTLNGEGGKLMLSKTITDRLTDASPANSFPRASVTFEGPPTNDPNTFRLQVTGAAASWLTTPISVSVFNAGAVRSSGQYGIVTDPNDLYVHRTNAQIRLVSNPADDAVGGAYTLGARIDEIIGGNHAPDFVLASVQVGMTACPALLPVCRPTYEQHAAAIRTGDLHFVRVGNAILDSSTALQWCNEDWAQACIRFRQPEPISHETPVANALQLKGTAASAGQLGITIDGHNVSVSVTMGTALDQVAEDLAVEISSNPSLTAASFRHGVDRLVVVNRGQQPAFSNVSNTVAGLMFEEAPVTYNDGTLDELDANVLGLNFKDSNEETIDFFAVDQTNVEFMGPAYARAGSDIHGIDYPGWHNSIFAIQSQLPPTVTMNNHLIGHEVGHVLFDTCHTEHQDFLCPNDPAMGGAHSTVDTNLMVAIPVGEPSVLGSKRLTSGQNDDVRMDSGPGTTPELLHAE